MIIVRLIGGLGNQMFQYALGKRLALLNNVELKVDISFLKKEGQTYTKRNLELNNFGIEIPLATEEELQKYNFIQRSSIRSRLQKFSSLFFPYYTIHETSLNYNDKILQSPKNSYLNGFWQTEKYFLPIEKTIREDFTFQKPLSGLSLKMSEQITATQSVSLHVRRGDYVNDPEISKVHGACGIGYYLKAIEVMKSKFSGLHLFVFSDDVDWVKNNLTTDLPITYVEQNSGFVDMQLMSFCKHNIIANSSFSWWGAWLNNNPGKIIIAPEKWFNDSSVNAKDIIPAGWIKL